MPHKRILLREDKAQYEMLALCTQRKTNVANGSDVARSGLQTLDYLFREINSADFAETVARLGVYWLATNQPPLD